MEKKRGMGRDTSNRVIWDVVRMDITTSESPISVICLHCMALLQKWLHRIYKFFNMLTLPLVFLTFWQ
ncbi:hypothetical protein AOLI_G00099320 [Acnodon oligacanthus]